MLAYAGIGSRNITLAERQIIKRIAKQLSTKFILYSGNAEGSDISFQEGSNGNCVVMLPYKGFNIKCFDYIKKSKEYFVLKTDEAIESVKKFHPNPSSLNSWGFDLMVRNYFQINGYEEYEQVSFVVCCAKTKNGKVMGGTGQAVRIALSRNIPVINIREEGWKEKLRDLYDKFELESTM